MHTHICSLYLSTCTHSPDTLTLQHNGHVHLKVPSRGGMEIRQGKPGSDSRGVREIGWYPSRERPGASVGGKHDWLLVHKHKYICTYEHTHTQKHLYTHAQVDRCMQTCVRAHLPPTDSWVGGWSLKVFPVRFGSWTKPQTPEASEVSRKEGHQQFLAGQWL